MSLSNYPSKGFHLALNMGRFLNESTPNSPSLSLNTMQSFVIGPVVASMSQISSPSALFRQNHQSERQILSKLNCATTLKTVSHIFSVHMC